MFDFSSILGAVGGGGGGGATGTLGNMDFSSMLNVELPDLATEAPNLMASASKAGSGPAKGAGLNKIMGGAGAVMDFAASFAPIAKDLSIGTAERMDDTGAVTHKTDVLGQTLGTTMAGAKAGNQIVPGIGGVIGGAVGLIGGGITSLIGASKDPTQNDILDRHKHFDMTNMTKMYRSNDTLPTQSQAAKHGMNNVANNKMIEVEKDEIVLRKTGKSFKKVADFKGGKTHEMGGETYVAQEGDIIFPGKKRLAVNQALRTRDWRRIESIRQSLPEDRHTGEYPDGTKGLKKSKYPTVHLPKNEDPLRQEELQIRYANQLNLSSEQLEGFRAQRESDRKYYDDKQAYIEQYTKDWRAGKTGNSPNFKFSQTSPEYRAMAKAREDSWYADNKREINPVVQSYYDQGPMGSKQNGPIQFSNPLMKGPGDINNLDADQMNTMLAGGDTYRGGTKSVKTDKTDKPMNNPSAGINTVEDINRGWTADMVQAYIDSKTVKGKQAPITGEELLALANKHDFPIELALIQGAVESNFGTKGAGTWTKNIYNWGNVTEGDKQTRKEALESGNRRVMDTVKVGVENYMKGVKNSYLGPVGGDWEALLEDDSFVNKDGNRYAAHKDYEKELTKLAAQLPDPHPPITYEDYMEQEFKQELTPEEQAILDRENYLESLIQSEKAIINNETPTGKDVRDKLQAGLKKDVAWMDENLYARNEMPSALQIELEEDDWDITKWIKEGWNNFPGNVKEGIGLMALEYPGKTRWHQDSQEQRFAPTAEGEAMKKDATAFHNFLQEQVGFLRRAGVEVEETLALVPKAVFGKTIEGSDMRIDADLASNFTQEEYDALIVKAKEQGIINNDYSEAYAYDLYKNPQRYYSTVDDAQLALDMATILNPKGLFQLGKMGLKGTGTVVKGGYKAGKATVKGTVQAAKYIKDNYKTIARKAPALAKKMFNKTVDFLSDKPMYKDGEAVFDAMADIVKEGKAPRGRYKVKWDNVSAKFTRAKDFVANIPSKMREAYYGSSLDDILKAEREILEHTGKSWDEVKAMSKEEIGAMFKDLSKANVSKYKTAAKAEDAAWGKYWDAYEDLQSLKTKPGLPASKIQDAERLLAKAQDDLLEASAETLRNKPGKPIALGSEQDMLDYANELRQAEKSVGETSLMRLDELAEVENLDDFQKGLVRAKTQNGGTWQKQLGGRIQQSDDGFLINKLHAEKDAKAAAQAARKETLSAKEAIDADSAFAKKFPDIANALKKDDVLRGHFRRGVGRGAATIDALLRAGVPETKARAFIESYDPEEVPTIPEEEQPQEETTVTETEESTVDMTPIPRPEFETPETSTEDKDDDKGPGFLGFLSQVGTGLSSLAKYAPAIYNISRGLQKPEKAMRRFITPQTLKYEDTSDPQRNLIDTAFNAAMSNARNLSGGLASNYRANVEAAWAERIARRNQIDAQEVDRSMQIANQNIGIRNRAEEYNSQVNQRADVMDMQSKAATNSFLAQGIQDVANVSAQDRRDKQAQKNQDLMLQMINSGRDFSFDPSTGSVSLNNSVKAPSTATPGFNSMLNIPIEPMWDGEIDNPFKIGQ